MGFLLTVAVGAQRNRFILVGYVSGVVGFLSCAGATVAEGWSDRK
jgi:hypothetical protein